MLPHHLLPPPPGTAVGVPHGVLVASVPATARWSATVDAWLAQQESAATRDGYAREARAWAAWCASSGTTELAAPRTAVETYAAYCRDHLAEASATRARRLAAISSLYAYAVDTGVLTTNPAAAVKRPKVSQDHSPTVGLTAAQGRAVLDAAQRESPRSHALVGLLLLGALRVSEACTARADHLGHDRGHRVLTVHGKGGTSRQLALVPRLAHALDVQLKGRTTGFVLVTRTGKAWDRAEAWRAVRRLAKHAGVPDADRISPHSLRHTAATLALEAGAPLHRVQDLLGHADPRTTRRYDRRRQQLDGHAAYALGQALA